ncbi:MAG: protein translocase subunit SecD [Deltaproteobacteria bacterium]|jgi:preprotein translocase subunit SecD|nr:protein translocase subunit SecD [Deltaproteobacteria bacterium]MCL5880138.1 protein translocase subunit SecD [Deltaproteobacteria bacterium]MDA8304812.1 protein translocase subunit SecD [Deltaproteobacteria bacterium]
MKPVKTRLILIISLIVISIFSVIPSIYPNTPGWWKAVIGNAEMRLGLDLQGGVYLVERVETGKAVKEKLYKDYTDIKSFVENKGYGKDAVSFVDSHIKIKGKLLKNTQELVKYLAEHHPSLQLMGDKINFKEPALSKYKEEAVSGAVEVMRNRIDQFGLVAPKIARQGKNLIVVELPGVKDVKQAVKLIGKTARLTFKLVDDKHNLLKALNGKIPKGDEILYHTTYNKFSHKTTKRPYLIEKPILMSGAEISSANVQINRYNQPIVEVALNSDGAKKFGDITTKYTGKRLAIILDDNVISAPVIEEPILGGNASISGRFTMAQASNLAIALRSGALPAPVKIIQNETVGPTLGADSIHAGILAAIVGTILVVGFMVFYYKLSGLIADFALIENVLFLMAALSLFGATLTLPGIAGIILTIGMAVDSNVLIFERIREELRENKPVVIAIENGYNKAFFTILDSHVTALITAAVLFYFGSGPVKGFAVTLSLGIIINLFTSLVGTKVIFDIISNKRELNKLSI